MNDRLLHWYSMEKRLLLIKKFYRTHHRLPSYKEMLTLFKLNSKKAIHDIVYKWVDEHILQKIDNKLAPTSKFFGLPLYGMVKAGYPIIADETKDYFTLDEYMIRDPEKSFLLKVSGDSMMNAGIFEGDLVVIEQIHHAYPGDIVLAEIDREWTLKYFKKDRKKRAVYLEAANPKYPPFYPTQELVIRGVVKGVIRKFAH